MLKIGRCLLKRVRMVSEAPWGELISKISWGWPWSRSAVWGLFGSLTKCRTVHRVSLQLTISAGLVCAKLLFLSPFTLFLSPLSHLLQTWASNLIQCRWSNHPSYNAHWQSSDCYSFYFLSSSCNSYYWVQLMLRGSSKYPSRQLVNSNLVQPSVALNFREFTTHSLLYLPTYLALGFFKLSFPSQSTT